MGWVRAAAGIFVVATLDFFAACSSSHEGLKQKPPATGGTGGVADAADVESDTGDSAPDAFIEPEGTPRLTLLHAVVDSERIAFCFSKVEDGIAGSPVGSPLPAAGLEPGQSLVVDAIPGLDWHTDDLLTTVVAGDFSLLQGKSCSEAIALAQSFSNEADAGSDASDAGSDASDAGAEIADASTDGDSEAAPPPPPPPPLRAMDLPVLPAPTLGNGYSYLLAASGCIGGPAFVDDSAEFVCGPGYTPETPTLSPVLVKMSRISSPDAVGLQALNASLGSDPVDLTSIGPPTRSLNDLDIAYGVAAGAISPQPPNLNYPRVLFGNPISASKLDVTPYGSGAVSYEQSWSAALSAGTLSDIEEGKNYTIVLSGARSTLTKMKWWNGPTLTVLANDP